MLLLYSESVWFGCHRQEAGARNGLPAVGLKLSRLVEKLQVTLYKKSIIDHVMCPSEILTTGR